MIPVVAYALSAEAHIDGLMWQGFGVGKTFGVEGFPSGEAFRLGSAVPNGAITRLFLRQTIGLGGAQEDVADAQLTLAGSRDISRLVITIGRFSAKDIFDNNAYANDSRTQFMNWALMANEAWDYPADATGFTTGLAVELNQPEWTLRYGWPNRSSMKRTKRPPNPSSPSPRDHGAGTGDATVGEIAGNLCVGTQDLCFHELRGTSARLN